MSKKTDIRSRLVTAVHQEIARRQRACAALASCDLEVCRAAVSVFGDIRAAAYWLTDGLGAGRKAPAVMAQTAAGRRAVMRALAQIEHGVFQ